jgi:hypothetical protein
LNFRPPLGCVILSEAVFQAEQRACPETKVEGISHGSAVLSLHARSLGPLVKARAFGMTHFADSKDTTIVISLFMPVILLVTVIASVGFGVLAAYAVVFGVLSAFGRSPQPKPQPEAQPRLVLVPTQNPASGD